MSFAGTPREFLQDLESEFRGFAPTALLVFVGGSRDVEPLMTGLSSRYPRARLAFCTTCGEISPQGFSQRSVSVVAFGGDVQAATLFVDDLSSFKFIEGAALLEVLARQIGTTTSEIAANPQDYVLVTLADGLSGREELLIASLGLFAPSVPLVGGSAGDDYRFKRTLVGVDRRFSANAAAVMLLKPNAPFHTFVSHHFSRAEQSHVVTEADPERRIVHRIDGYPAATMLARMVGVTEEELRANSADILAHHSTVFGFRVGADTLMRAVMRVQGPDLLMGGALEMGTIIYSMKPGDLIGTTRSALRDASTRVPEPQGMLLFDCGGRMLSARLQGCEQQLGELYGSVSAGGFSTYGEQFGPVQVNQTLTGLVLGSVA